MTDPTTRYALAVTAGAIVAGPHVRAQCARHLRDLQRTEIRFDVDKAQRALDFFPDILRLNGGQFEGKPFVLEPAQEFIIGSLFGWTWAHNGLRRFAVAYIEAGKGSGKSPLIAGIGLYGMVADQEPRAEIYGAATKRDQAMILFRDAVAMVDQSPALARRLKKSGRDDKVWNLFDERTGSWFRPISADDGQSGPRPHMGLIDEVHEHKTATVINMMSAGRKWRQQPLVVLITNSGTDRQSVCWEYHEKGVRVAAGVADDDTLFPYICALDEDRHVEVPADEVGSYAMLQCRCGAMSPVPEDHEKECPVAQSKVEGGRFFGFYPKDDPFENEDCWVKANPTLGAIIQKEYLRREVIASQGMPSKRASVSRLNFCVWTEAFNPAISYEAWQAIGDDYTLERFRGCRAVLALDLSATTDMTAAVLNVQQDGIDWLWPMMWLPEDGLYEREKKDHVPYTEWKRDGYLYTTPGAAIDKDFVVAEIEALLAQYDITVELAPFDRHRIDVLKAACDRQGVSWPLQPHGQGFESMGPAWAAFETKLVRQAMRHPRNPCFTWTAANAVVVENPAGDKKPDKSKATGRIDPIVAAVMSVGEMEKNPVTNQEASMEWL